VRSFFGTTPSIYKIRKWLERNDNYTLQKPVRRKFKRARVLVSEPYEQYDADIADLSSLAGENDKWFHVYQLKKQCVV
jgi:hypothetical protein